MFVDRKDELKFLQKEYERNGASFVVIYGRRRVGKTELIKEFSKFRKSIYFLATQEDEEQLRRSFQKVVYKVTKAPVLKPENVLDWEDIFLVASSFFSEKIVIAIDEFQNIVLANPSFPSILQKIWDNVLKDRNVMLILCGSLISMMHESTLAYSSPLYGRRTGQIKLKPISFTHYKEFFKEDTGEMTLLKYFAVTGGVPKYIELVDLSKDVYEMIRDNILEKNSFLFEEPFFLLERDLKETGSYFSILKTISLGNRRLSLIAAKSGIKQQSLSYYLKVLSDMDIVKREVPVTEKNPEKSKKGLYFIKDYFLDFWFKFVYPNLSFLEMGETEYVMEEIGKYFEEKHVSFVYEDLCREKVKELNSTEFFPLKFEKIGRWWDKHEEIDIVGTLKGKAKLFGECKFTKKLVGLDIYYSLLEKSRKLSDEEDNFFIIFSKGGFEKSLIELSKSRKNLLLVKGISNVIQQQ